MTEQRLAFTGRGEQTVAETLPHDFTPSPRLTDEQRAHIRALICAEHQGSESEASALARLIRKTEADLTRYRETEVEHLIDRRLTNLRRYQREDEA